jgi:hypothetical protein
MLAPRWGEITLTLSVAPGAKRLVLQRDYKFKGDADLCDAESMRMIARLPISRTHKIPATCFAWSPDGLLFAYPAKAQEGGPAASPYVWQIIDATSGKTLLDTEPLAAESAAPLAAHLNRERLRVVFADGSAVEYAVNPTVPVLRGKTSVGSFDFAVFSPDGSQILTATDHGDDDPEAAQTYSVVAKPEENLLSIDGVGVEADDGWTSTAAITERFPWARWEPPFREHAAGDAREGPLPLKVEGSRLEVTDINGADQAPRAPIRAESQIECAAFSGNRVAVGTASGLLGIHEVLPRIGHGFPPISRAPEAERNDEEREDGWRTVEGRKNSDLQHRGHDWRLRGKDGNIVSLQPHPNWMYPMYAMRPADGAFVVMGGYSAGSAGYSSAGMVVCDIATGSLTSDLEPVDEIRGLIFLGESHRVAAMASTEVIVAEAEHDAFRRIASLPVVDAVSLYHITSRGWLAVATAKEVHLFDEKDFSQVATLALEATETESAAEDGVDAWAEDPQRGWLAYRSVGRLDLWSLRNNRALLAGLSVPTSRGGMVFGEKDGMIGLEVVKGATIRLARTDGIERAQLTALRDFSACVSGSGFAGGSRSLATYSAEQRRDRAGEIDRKVLGSLLPGSDALLDKIAAIPPRRSTPEVWLPVWQRLSIGGDDGPIIARWAAELGTDDPWFRAYIRGLVGHSDALLYAWQRGEVPVEDDEFDNANPLPHDDNISTYQRLAGDPDAMRELKQAAWLAVRTDPQRLGKKLVEDSEADEFPGLDLKAVEKLDPAALKAMRAALNEGDMRDWRRVAIDELPERGAALEKLDARVAATLAAFEADKSVASVISHAEALALRGKLEEAGKFLSGKVPDEAVLDLSQAHFLIASRLNAVCGPSVDKALVALKSEWLWKSWLEAAPGDLKERIARVMPAVDGRGPAAVAALKAAMKADDPDAIAAVLELARDLPVRLREYATARALWVQGKKAEVFALWPDEIPEFQEIMVSSDWGGWEEALPWKETNDFTDRLSNDLTLLKVAPEATVEDLRALATRLLEPETTATFGIRRVRDAMVACSLQLAYDAASDALVMAMVERARLAGAPNAECLRIEARNFMAAGDFTGGYARWVQLFDTENEAAIPSDYLEAARCVMEDMQPAAAIELLTRGKNRFPADASFTLDAAWLLLTYGHPEESGVMLEHGFTIPFPDEQKQTVLAMLVCAAEQTSRTDRADKAFAELLALSPDWGSEETLKGIDWPEELKQSLLAVAARNR